ncbi:MAG: hypothetical protein C0453_14415 [Comamonadaceae bacterium]|nr:hypothetical protein [Comamonadaceae bacterium]
MPLVQIRLARRDTPTTAEQKAALIAGITDMMQSVLDKRRESVVVIIDEVDPDNWGQINERLKVLIAAYKTLGGSFTGVLTVDPAHLRELRQGVAPEDGTDFDSLASASERRRRIRDTVEAALSDVILLGTEEQVRLAAHAANEMVMGRNVEVAALVVSLRDFIRQALDLTPVPPGTTVPSQGPLRVSAGGGSARRGGGADTRGGRGGGGAGGGGAGMGVGVGVGTERGASVAGASR